MLKDNRYNYVRSVWKAGDLTTFNDIFQIIPRSIVAKDLGLNYERFVKKIFRPERFTFEDVSRIARLLEIEPKILANLVLIAIEENANSIKK